MEIRILCGRLCIKVMYVVMIQNQWKWRIVTGVACNMLLNNGIAYLL